MKPPVILAFVGALTASLILTTGCSRPEVQVYDVPKDTSLADEPMVGGPRAPVDSVAWTPAPQWQQLPPTNFRKGNYLFEDRDGKLEITVTAFPGSTGGLLANANRWLRQASLPEINEEQLQDRVTEVTLAGNVPATVVDLKAATPSPDSTRIYAAIVPYDGQYWFFKMSGPFSTLQSQIPAFSSLLRGLRFGEEAAKPLAAESPDHLGDLTFATPAGWIQSPGSSMRIASLAVVMEGYPEADFAITSFPGDTGGELANVNRWRRQIGLAPWSADQVEAAAQTVENAAGHTFRVFELKPEADGERIRVAILFHAGKSWFFKLRGDAVVVDLQKEKFLSLLQSVHFSHDGHNH